MRLPGIAIFATAAILWSQTPPAFDVVSIKPSDRDKSGLPYRVGPDILTTSGALKHLIMLAYDADFDQVTGGADWTQSEFYDIQAKAAGPASTRQIKAMLQTLLADRFQLKLAHETKVMPGYALVVAKNGPKLSAPRTDVPPESTGVIQLGGGEIWGRGITMSHLAHGLHLELQVPVINQTEIEGHYDCKLRFEEANRELMDDSDTAPAATAPKNSIFTALQELGLRLESRKLPVEILKIESAVKPAEN